MILSNDSDFGIGGLANAAPPYQLAPKMLPDGSVDDGEYLEVDMSKVPSQF